MRFAQCVQRKKRRGVRLPVQVGAHHVLIQSYWIRRLFLLFFHVDDFAAFIVSAFWADGMRQAHLAAVAALGQGSRGQSIMGAPAVAATLGMFALWMWGHWVTPSFVINYNATKRLPSGRKPFGRLSDYTG